MAWDVWIHTCSHRLLIFGYGSEAFHATYIVIDAFRGWLFPSMRVFQGISCVTIFVGMLSILLHVNFNCIFILDLLWVMWKRLY